MKASLPIEIDHEIMSGIPAFTGTRVSVEALFDYLMKGSNLDEFLDCFPTLKRADVFRFLTIPSTRRLRQGEALF